MSRRRGSREAIGYRAKFGHEIALTDGAMFWGRSTLIYEKSLQKALLLKPTFNGLNRTRRLSPLPDLSDIRSNVRKIARSINVQSIA